MTTPCPTPFPSTTPRTGLFTLFVIISESDIEITTLPIRPAPPSPDHTPALYGYTLDSSDDSSDEDLTAPPPTWYPLLSSELTSSSHRRSRPLSPSLPLSVPPLPKNMESVGDNGRIPYWKHWMLRVEHLH
ncbi:hypothetical protein Tco_1147171 [Tanacetum coccineum]